jgi:hypothetical protein
LEPFSYRGCKYPSQNPRVSEENFGQCFLETVDLWKALRKWLDKKKRRS